MDFYISWSRSDPVYCNYFSVCNILINPFNTIKSFKISNWKYHPCKLIIDSGAYCYLNKSEEPITQFEVFKQQLRLLGVIECPTFICHLDYPIGNNNASLSASNKAIEQTIANAYEFLELYTRYNLRNVLNVQPIAVIQGYDELSIYFCAVELKRLGFKKFGLGSLAALYNHKKILSRIKAAINVVGAENLHVFGISRIDILQELYNLQIMSIDSSRPIKAGIYNSIFYSNPFRIYEIPMPKSIRTRNQVLTKPLLCDCPICTQDPYILLLMGAKKFSNARAIHNYYHLSKSLVQLQKL